MLYQKYRPTTINEMVGNEKTLAAFERHFSNEIHSHVHCLIGPRGAGKTSTARIAASMLGADGLSITEVNCGTERGIASMKDVIDLAAYRPPTGKARVIILDEAHSLLGPGKKALLKPTEDVPPFTYWFFCTTDPDTLFSGDAGAALKSRMTFWKLKALSKPDITKLVTEIAQKEHIQLSAAALASIVDGCNGIPREALVLLEQAITGDPMVAEESKKETVVIDFCRALYKSVGVPGAWPTLGAQLTNLKKQGVMMEAIRHTALAYATTTLIARSDVACLRLIEHLSEPVYDQGEAFPKMAAQVFKLCHLKPDQLQV
jgi:DNA polymerase III gamma/tau subunit